MSARATSRARGGGGAARATAPAGEGGLTVDIIRDIGRPRCGCERREGGWEGRGVGQAVTRARRRPNLCVSAPTPARTPRQRTIAAAAARAIIAGIFTFGAGGAFECVPTRRRHLITFASVAALSRSQRRVESVARAHLSLSAAPPAVATAPPAVATALPVVAARLDERSRQALLARLTEGEEGGAVVEDGAFGVRRRGGGARVVGLARLRRAAPAGRALSQEQPSADPSPLPSPPPRAHRRLR